MLTTPSAKNERVPALELGAATLEKYQRLQAILRKMESVLVAYSGGVDSTLLLKVAHDELGERALGALALSPAYAPEEGEAALQLARDLGIRVLTVETHELEDERYLANKPNRCYFCKTELFTHLTALAQQHGLRYVAYGVNKDDEGDFRPGQRAAREFGVRGPLLEAGLHKSEIRALARWLGLSVWDKPALACFSSRIPYGTRIDIETLQKVYQAEKLLRELGLRQVRVRHHGVVARIEVERQDMPRLIEEETSRQVTEGLRRLGYLYVTLDLLGFRSGSLNEGFFKKKRPTMEGHQEKNDEQKEGSAG
ncbi:ATP-dependent sacrificial sulfur transferase LarE [Thermogemmatispora carboxidivorans]|uniref:ATP-dependent sacrificial sulfur transferase LarE n=1 Tax=Thermogemmatispora carboxidivorans TaxID=1382306 RepID=UPI00069A9E30|nr:ATP-dependent sacrificial sulfur transferase LarE [Thermogemmatispora carboxidivorans]